MGFHNCSMFCCALLCVHSSFATISMGKRELVSLLYLSSWCLVIVVWLLLTMPQVCLQFVIVLFPDHYHLLLLYNIGKRAMRGMVTIYFGLYKSGESLNRSKPEGFLASIRECEKAISQSHTADQPKALRGRDTEHKQSHDSKKTIKVIFLSELIANLERKLNTV